MTVTGTDSTLCIEMAVEHLRVAYFYRRVGGQWVKYKRQCLERLH